VLTATRREVYNAQIDVKVRGVANALLSLDAVVTTVTQAFTYVIPQDGVRPLVEEALAQNRVQEWGAPLRTQMREILYEHHDAIAERVRCELLAAIQDGALTTPEEEQHKEES
jgi:hypothetical protein